MWFPTSHFYPSKCDITRPPNFRRFLKIPEKCCSRNIWEPSKNWQVSSYRILTDRPPRSFINVKLVIHYLMDGFQPFSSTYWHVRSHELPIFIKFCKPLRNFSDKNFPVVFRTSTNNGDPHGRFDFFLLDSFDFATYKIDSLTSQ